MKYFNDLTASRRLIYSGKSTHYGFRVDVSHSRLGLDAAMQISGHEQSQLADSPKMSIICLIVFASISGALVLSISRGFFVGVGAYFLLLFGISTLVGLGSMPKEVRRWHACEHKVIASLMYQCVPTMENLRALSPVTPYCGSVWLLMIVGFLECLGTLLLWPGHRLIVSMGAVCFLVGLSMLVRSRSTTRIPTLVSLAISFPVIGLAGLAQRKFCLSEPTGDQLQQTLDLLHDAYRQHRWLASPKLRRNPEFKEIMRRSTCGQSS